MMKLIIYCAVVINSVSACSTKKELEITYEDDKNPSGRYSWYGLRNRECNLKHSEMNNPAKHQPSSKESACKFPPSLRLMEYGVLTRTDDKLENAFIFACETNRKIEIDGHLYDHPSNVSLNNVDRIKYSQEVINAEDVPEKYSKEIPINFNRKAFSFSENLQNENAKSYKVIRAEYVQYQASVDTFRPTKNMLYRYRSLPTEIKTNIGAYHDFVHQYGVSIRNETQFGGFVEILLPNNNKLDKQSLKDVLDRELARSTTLAVAKTFFAGYNATSILQWNAMVKRQPLPLYSKYIMLHDFIDKNDVSIKRKSLQAMVNYVQNSHILSDVLYALKAKNSNNHMSKFLVKELEAESMYICPNEQISATIRQGIIETNNINLNKFFLKCTHKSWYWEKKEKHYIITRNWNLLPGLCYTKETPFTTCAFVDISLPPGIKCVLFFKDVSCQGLVYATITSEKNLADAIIESKSWTLCTN